ncbi:hypothetical protein Acsp01_35010 [Actinoplanes sp. NBRC 101535]|nr:hypothetical protein Acsp01_35010 [Actinoplanes sp. NBRC 101535]
MIPAHDGYTPIIAGIGAVPAHRGQGYVAALPATGTAPPTAENMPRVRTATDVGDPLGGCSHPSRVPRHRTPRST